MRRLRGAGVRRGARGGGSGGRAGPPDTLADRVAALAASAGWQALAGYVADTSFLTLVGANVSVWGDVYGVYDATQAVDAMRPAYSATSLGGGPGVTFNLLHTMASGNIDITGLTAFAWIIACVHSGGGTQGVPVAFGDGSSAAGLFLQGNSTAFQLRTRASSTTITVGAGDRTVPHIISGTWDTTLATDEGQTRYGGESTVTSRPGNNNTTMNWTAEEVNLGSRPGLVTPNIGVLGAAFLLGGSSAVDVAMIESVEMELAEALAEGDYINRTGESGFGAGFDTGFGI